MFMFQFLRATTLSTCTVQYGTKSIAITNNYSACLRHAASKPCPHFFVYKLTWCVLFHIYQVLDLWCTSRTSLICTSIIELFLIIDSRVREEAARHTHVRVGSWFRIQRSFNSIRSFWVENSVLRGLSKTGSSFSLELYSKPRRLESHSRYLTSRCSIQERLQKWHTLI